MGFPSSIDLVVEPMKTRFSVKFLQQSHFKCWKQIILTWNAKSMKKSSISFIPIFPSQFLGILEDSPILKGIGASSVL